MVVSGKVEVRGQVAVVTGAARGVGRAVAEMFAREGVKLALADVLPLNDTIQAVESRGVEVVGLSTDITKLDDVKALVQTTVESFGRIDILVTCAGVYGAGNFSSVDEEEWDRVNNINLKGTYFSMQQVYPYMEKQGYGKIVCIGSVAGKIGGLLTGPHYVATKGAIHAMVKWVARYGAKHGVYANAIAPGGVDTEMIKGYPYSADIIPLNRFAQPEEIAEAVLYLASNASHYVTGTVLDVNGGLVMY